MSPPSPTEDNFSAAQDTWAATGDGLQAGPARHRLYSMQQRHHDICSSLSRVTIHLPFFSSTVNVFLDALMRPSK
jgi:hypothetical protein